MTTMEGSNDKQTPVHTKKKSMGLISSMALIIGSVIGSGIFISPRGILLGTGSYGLSVIVWIICGLICIPGCLCYAELGTLIPSSGGDYTYIKDAFGDWAGFLRVWTEICCTRPATMAVCAITAAIYILYPLYPDCSPPLSAVMLLACFFIMGLIMVNILSTPASIQWQNVTFYGKIAALILVIGLGIYQVIRGRYQVFLSPFENTKTTTSSLAIAFYVGLFPYSGWNYLNNAIEDVKNPEKIFPIAIMSSIITCTVIYVLAYSAYFTSLTPLEVMTSDAVAVSFASNIYRPLAYVIPLAVSLSALGSLNGQIFSIVRMFFVAGRDGLLPQASALLHIKKDTPIIPLLIEGALGIMYVLVGDANTLLNYLSFNYWIVCMFAAVSVLVFRRTKPKKEFPRPVDAGVIAPVIFIIAMTLLTIVNIIYNPIEIIVGIAILLSGLPVYWFFVTWKGKPKQIASLDNKITRTLQKLLCIVPETKFE
ncbi:unnamed protein product [Didymodactylos carnosus]|uniref:Amino acid transporter n=3 Tax=Didymodactylos carnosus TaxID=1234261 RepID=A0A814JF72_9BILA|nr:unnamed protein product [Didymodactylos carnosus]CAF3808011.1 unnamed protein product [Didymodactylos carnosus]